MSTNKTYDEVMNPKITKEMLEEFEKATKQSEETIKKLRKDMEIDPADLDKPMTI